MTNKAEGDRRLAARRTAEEALRQLDPHRYQGIEHWLDKELYGGLYGHGGAERLPVAHRPEIMDLLRARAAVYRGMKTGAITSDGGRIYDSEVGNEQMAQTIDACLETLGEGPELPPGRRWDEFIPEGYL